MRYDQNIQIPGNLEYAASSWDTDLKKDILKIEAVQRRAARFVKNKYNRPQVPLHHSIVTCNGIPSNNDAKYYALPSFIRNSMTMSVLCYLHTSTPK